MKVVCAMYSELDEAQHKNCTATTNSTGYSLARKLSIPMVRIGGQRILHRGYRGETRQIFDTIVNAFIETKQEASNVGYSYI